jgi:hypothetical protein
MHQMSVCWGSGHILKEKRMENATKPSFNRDVTSIPEPTQPILRIFCFPKKGKKEIVAFVFLWMFS